MELYGRKMILSDVDEVNAENVLQVLQDTKTDFITNSTQEKYLFDYYRGKHEIRFKKKETRPEINHRISIAIPLSITDFKTGYLVGDPVVYTSRESSDASTEEISKLNGMMLYEDKATSDKQLVDWMHITGHGYRMVLPDNEDAPFEMTVLPPMSTYVVYSNKPSHRPLCGVYTVTDKMGQRTYFVYTDKRLFTVKEGKLEKEEPHILGMIPIIEYPLNEARIGAFESVLSLVDAIEYCESDRLDGLTTFINSLCVLYNAELPEGEDGNSIREQGLICLKSVGDNKADIKILSEQLDQTSAQTLKDDLYQTILRIVGMPNQSDGNTSDSSNNGAMFLKQGYQLAETRAKDTELMFKESERKMLKLVLRICQMKNELNIGVSDIDIVFTRRAYSDSMSKTTILTQLLGCDSVAPIDAWSISGVVSDPEEACKRGQEWKAQTVPEKEDIPNEEPITD